MNSIIIITIKKKEEELLEELGVGEDAYFQGNRNRRRPNTEVDDSSMDENVESPKKKYNPEENKTVSLLTSLFFFYYIRILVEW